MLINDLIWKGFVSKITNYSFSLSLHHAMGAKKDHILVRKRLRKHVWDAVLNYNMVQQGDLVMVCLSGGKDSYTMLDMLQYIKVAGDIDFDIIAVNLDQKQPGFPEHILPEYLNKIGVKYEIIEKDTYSVVVDKIPEGKTMCSLCSRLRRGNLYTAAERLGATKIALGHHRNDILETFFLNLFYSGRVETMPPKYLTDDKKHIVIRPLAFCPEADIETYASFEQYPIIPCNLCGSQDGLKRVATKKLLEDWQSKYPGRLESMFTALQNVSPTHLLDHKINDFGSLESERVADLIEKT